MSLKTLALNDFTEVVETIVNAERTYHFAPLLKLSSAHSFSSNFANPFIGLEKYFAEVVYGGKHFAANFHTPPLYPWHDGSVQNRRRFIRAGEKQNLSQTQISGHPVTPLKSGVIGKWFLLKYFLSSSTTIFSFDFVYIIKCLLHQIWLNIETRTAISTRRHF